MGSWHERKDEYIGTTFNVPVGHRSILFSGPTREKSKFWAITCVCCFLVASQLQDFSRYRQTKAPTVYKARYRQSRF